MSKVALAYIVRYIVTMEENEDDYRFAGCQGRPKWNSCPGVGLPEHLWCRACRKKAGL